MFALPVFNDPEANKAISRPKKTFPFFPVSINHQKLRFCSTSSEVNRDTEAPQSGVISGYWSSCYNASSTCSTQRNVGDFMENI